MYIHNKTKKNLIIALSDMKYTKLDLLMVICGAEGWGKSFMARGIGKYCAEFLGSKFGVDNVHFDLDDYMKSSYYGGEFRVNILDEARKLLFKRRAMSKKVVEFTNYLSECRAKRQVHIICVPSYSDLDRYVVAWRLNMLFAINKEYLPDDKRESELKPRFGCYRLFTSKKSLIYAYDKGYNYYPRKYEARDNWTAKDVFSKEEENDYDKKKDDATFKKYIEVEKKPKPRAADRWLKKALMFIRDHLGWNHKQTYDAIGMSCPIYFRYMKAEEESTNANNELHTGI